MMDYLDFISSGESAQVWALDKNTQELFYLPDGEAEEYRRYTKESLICPVNQCHSSLTTRGGNKRHHFVHVNNSKEYHSNETINHFQSKMEIAYWAKEQSNVLSVELEKRLSNGRIPDILVELKDGSLIDIETEFKVSSLDKRKQRDEELLKQGIVTQWLWSNTVFLKNKKMRKDVTDYCDNLHSSLTYKPFDKIMGSIISTDELGTVKMSGFPPIIKTISKEYSIIFNNLESCYIGKSGIMTFETSLHEYCVTEELERQYYNNRIVDVIHDFCEGILNENKNKDIWEEVESQLYQDFLNTLLYKEYLRGYIKIPKDALVSQVEYSKFIAVYPYLWQLDLWKNFIYKKIIYPDYQLKLNDLNDYISNNYLVYNYYASQEAIKNWISHLENNVL